MKEDIESLRSELAAARQSYLADMKWLRDRFGIVPAAPAHEVRPAYWLALNTLENPSAASFTKALKAFKKLHRAIMKETVWNALEDAKRTLKILQHQDPEAFARKLLLWNQASHWFTNFNTAPGRPITANYRKALLVLAKL